MIKIYIAGPLFTEAEIYQRKKEARLLKEVLEQSNKEYSVFNPIDMPIGDSPTAKMIFDKDYEAIKNSNVFFFDLANMDDGTLVELGIVVERLKSNPSIKVYPVISDFRVHNKHTGIDSPVGFNSFVIGALKSHEIEVFHSFEDAMNTFKQTI